MRAIIIEDDPFYIKLLEDFCKKAQIAIATTFSEPLSAIQYVGEHHVDLVFLDVHLPNLDGFEVIENLSKLPIIMITQDQTKAVEAFEYNVVDFLLKPFDFNRFLKAVRKVEYPKKTKSSDSERNIYVNVNKRLIRIACDQIQFVTAKGNYIHIWLENKESVVVHTTLKKIEELLPPDDFKKVHRSYIVNTGKIVDIEDSTIVIGRSVIPLGKTFRESLLDELNLLQ